MSSASLVASTLAAALVLGAVGSAAMAREQPNNRGYVVGKGGVARLADGGQPGGEAAQPDQTAQADTASGRLVIKTKSSPPVMEPIGVNEPGVNRAAPPAGGGAASASYAATGRATSPAGVSQTEGEAAQRGIEKKDIRRGAAFPPQPVNR
ncbi:hypothetical protein [Altererythrobacter lauratis]|uniref:DUF4148 domain-containing protein n=1 Tax=Alteraurantiacibacter lauratis TaxID=2054627 RepID=A0ABV7EGA5_9SPHN